MLVDLVPTDAGIRLLIDDYCSRARFLGLKIVAEGIETEEQVKFLKQNDCDYAQGYYYSKPVGMDIIKQQLR